MISQDGLLPIVIVLLQLPGQPFVSMMQSVTVHEPAAAGAGERSLEA